MVFTRRVFSFLPKPTFLLIGRIYAAGISFQGVSGTRRGLCVAHGGYILPSCDRLPLGMDKEDTAFPVRVVLVSTTEQEQLVDQVFEDMDSLLDGLAPILGRESREDTREVAEQLHQGENVRFDEKILALFPCKE